MSWHDQDSNCCYYMLTTRLNSDRSLPLYVVFHNVYCCALHVQSISLFSLELGLCEVIPLPSGISDPPPSTVGTNSGDITSNGRGYIVHSVSQSPTESAVSASCAYDSIVSAAVGCNCVSVDSKAGDRVRSCSSKWMPIHHKPAVVSEVPRYV